MITTLIWVLILLRATALGIRSIFTRSCLARYQYTTVRCVDREIIDEPTTTGGVYVLQLHGGYYYVGKTSRAIKERVKEHFKMPRSWMKLHHPIKVVPTITRLPSDFVSWERAETLERIWLHGASKVRGWQYTLVNLTEVDEQAIVTQLCERKDLCRRCGRGNHFMPQCKLKQKRAKWMTRIFTQSYVVPVIERYGGVMEPGLTPSNTVVVEASPASQMATVHLNMSTIMSIAQANSLQLQLIGTASLFYMYHKHQRLSRVSAFTTSVLDLPLFLCIQKLKALPGNSSITFAMCVVGIPNLLHVNTAINKGKYKWLFSAIILACLGSMQFFMESLGGLGIGMLALGRLSLQLVTMHFGGFKTFVTRPPTTKRQTKIIKNEVVFVHYLLWSVYTLLGSGIGYSLARL